MPGTVKGERHVDLACACQRTVCGDCNLQQAVFVGGGIICVGARRRAAALGVDRQRGQVDGVAAPKGVLDAAFRVEIKRHFLYDSRTNSLHVCNLRRHRFCVVDVGADRAGRREREHGFAHQLIEFFVAGDLRAVIRSRDIGAGRVIVEHVDDHVELSDGVAIANRSVRLASNGGVDVSIASADVGVGDSLPDQGVAGVCDARPLGNEDGERLRLGDRKPFRAVSRFCLWALLQIVQFCQCVKVLAFGAARNILICGVVVVDPLLDDDAGYPLRKQLFRAGRSDAHPGQVLINGNQKICDFRSVGRNKLKFGITTHRRFPPPR